MVVALLTLLRQGTIPRSVDGCVHAIYPMGGLVHTHRQRGVFWVWWALGPAYPFLRPSFGVAAVCLHLRTGSIK